MSKQAKSQAPFFEGGQREAQGVVILMALLNTCVIKLAPRWTHHRRKAREVCGILLASVYYNSRLFVNIFFDFTQLYKGGKTQNR